MVADHGIASIVALSIVTVFFGVCLNDHPRTL